MLALRCVTFISSVFDLAGFDVHSTYMQIGVALSYLAHMLSPPEGFRSHFWGRFDTAPK